jgi:hypothetical protein
MEQMPVLNKPLNFASLLAELDEPPAADAIPESK